MFLQYWHKNKSDGGLESYHKDGGTPFRGTYPAKGYFYHEAGDFFHRPQPFNSWTLDTTEKDGKPQLLTLA